MSYTDSGLKPRTMQKEFLLDSFKLIDCGMVGGHSTVLMWGFINLFTILKIFINVIQWLYNNETNYPGFL
jgi:hypothetical protein